MGIDKSAVTFRLEERHLQLLAAARGCPLVENNSHALRALLDGLVALMVTGRMPEWMDALQGVLRKPLCTDDYVAHGAAELVGPETVRATMRPGAAEAMPLPSPETEDGRASEEKTEALKRPPRRIVYQGHVYRISIPGQRPIFAKTLLVHPVQTGAQKKAGPA